MTCTSHTYLTQKCFTHWCIFECITSYACHIVTVFRCRHTRGRWFCCNFYILQLDLTSSSETNHFFRPSVWSFFKLTWRGYRSYKGSLAVPIVQFFNVVQISDDVLYMMIMSSSNCHIVNKDIISSCGPFLHFIFFSLVYKSHVSQQPVFLAAFEPFREDVIKANNPKNSTLDKSLCLK